MLAFSSDYSSSSAELENKCMDELENCLKKISNAGFSHVHWAHEWDGDYTYSIYEMIQIKEWFDKYNLKAKGVHATEGSSRSTTKSKYHYRWEIQNRRDYTSENELNRLAGVDLIKNRIDLSHIIGATEIVLHMQLPYKSFEQDESFRTRYYNQIIKSLSELEYYAKAKNVKICVENLLGTPNEHQVYQFDLLFNRFDKDFLGFCFDTGHANITGTDCLELAKRYSDRIFMIHLCDNVGITGQNAWDDGAIMTPCDQHKLPFEGNFDWDGLAKVLANSPYELPCVLETCFKEDDETAYLERALKLGSKFSDLVVKYRGNSNE